MAVDFENLVGSIIDDRVTGSGPTVSRYQDAALKFECQNGGRVGLGEVGPGPGRGEGRYLRDVAEAAQQTNKIIGASSAAGRIHHWPVR
jgi:hypothetical protein